MGTLGNDKVGHSQYTEPGPEDQVFCFQINISVHKDGFIPPLGNMPNSAMLSAYAAGVTKGIIKLTLLIEFSLYCLPGLDSLNIHFNIFRLY